MITLKNSLAVILTAIQVQMCLHDNPKPTLGINKEIKPYVERFIEYGRKYRGDTFNVVYINMDIAPVIRDTWDSVTSEDMVGWCKPFIFPMEIMIQSSFWVDATDLEREEIVFHELGHCVLSLQHDETMESYGPITIMYPYTLGESIYKPKREHYIKELFTRTNK